MISTIEIAFLIIDKNIMLDLKVIERNFIIVKMFEDQQVPLLNSIEVGLIELILTVVLGFLKSYCFK